MSRARAVVVCLLEVLEAERAAIRKLDGRGVSEAAVRKAELAAELTGLAPAEIDAAREDLGRLRSELRRNGTLLAHARSCLRDVMDIAAQARGLPRSGPQLRARL